MKIQVNVNKSLDDLWHAANKAGFLRENPKKAWTEREKTEAARWYLEKLIEAALPK